MDISPAIVGAASAAVTVPIFMHLMRNIGSLKHSPDSAKTLEELTAEYSGWEKAASALLIVFVAAIGLILWKALNLLSTLQLSYVDKGVYFISQPPVIWALPSLFLAIFLSVIPLHYLYRKLLGVKRYAEYTEYGNQKFGVNSLKLLIYMGYIIIPICLAFTILSLDHYARINKSSVAINRFFSIGETEYDFSQIQSIELTKSFKAPNGNIVKKPHFVVHFNDNTSLNLNSAMYELSFEQQQDAATYISSNALKKITINDPYPD